MTQIGGPAIDTAVPIGDVAAPPFGRAPDPAVLFLARASRFRDLAEGHDLKPYLEFLAGIAETQHAIQDALPPAEVPPADAQARCREYGMPPLDRGALMQPAFLATLDRFLAAVAAVEMPDAARAALARVQAADEAERLGMAGAVIDMAIPFEQVAEHVFVAAALQVHAARLAAQLDAPNLVPVGEGACPACGGPPVASMIVGWRGAHGARFCSCSVCSTQWNHVRIRCTACGSTKGISYQETEGADGLIKAECCGECRSYLKILNQSRQPTLDPVADDVASMALDLLVSADGVQRSGVNPFLLGY